MSDETWPSELPALPDSVTSVLTAWMAEDDAVSKWNSISAWLLMTSPLPKKHPVGAIRWVPSEQVRANNWNPNSTATNEMRLLHTSISADGFTQPVVTIYEPETAEYMVVDGFHRWTVLRTQSDIYDSTGGLMPVVVIDTNKAGLMASTIRHNRARGKHSVMGMSNLVFQMLQEGRSDVEVCNEIGLEPEELLRLKHITGFSKLLANHEYNQAWMSSRQARARGKWLAEHPEDADAMVEVM